MREPDGDWKQRALTRAEGELYGRPYAHQFIPLIRRNSKLPATRTEVFFTLFEDQEEVEIKVFQGEDPDALKNVATLARAEQALAAAPAEDREEMINLMEDLRDALREGAAERAGELRRELDEILFYLE